MSCDNIDIVPDVLGQLRLLTCLHICSNSIRRLQPALHGLVLQLEAFVASQCPLEDLPQEVYWQGLDALKRYLREEM